MKIEINHAKEIGYYIAINGDFSDYLIAEKLNITSLDYQNELLKYNAFIKQEEMFFKYEEDIKKCVEEYIEPMLIINELINNFKGE